VLNKARRAITPIIPTTQLFDIPESYNKTLRERQPDDHPTLLISHRRKKIFFDFFASNERPRLTIAKSKILSYLVLPMENGSKNKFKRSILTLKIIILRVWSVF
jgi:hypothetical protein